MGYIFSPDDPRPFEGSDEEREEMIALITELKKDKARLDFIQNRKTGGCLIEIIADKFTGKWAVGSDDPKYDSLREAIDAKASEGSWWCCKADYPNHEPTCKNYQP